MHRCLLAASLLLAACGASPPDAEEPAPDPLESVEAQELYRRGMLLAQAGDLGRAEQYLAASMERGMDPQRVVPALLGVCVEASRLVAALDYAEPYLAQNPGEWSLRLLVANIRMGLGQHQRAREELHQVVRDAPDEPQAHYFLGVLERDAFEDEDAAREHFRQYLALAPDGEHQAEARAGLTAEERGLPVRVPMPAEDESADEAEEEPEAPTEEAAP